MLRASAEKNNEEQSIKQFAAQIRRRGTEQSALVVSRRFSGAWVRIVRVACDEERSCLSSRCGKSIDEATKMAQSKIPVHFGKCITRSVDRFFDLLTLPARLAMPTAVAVAHTHALHHSSPRLHQTDTDSIIASNHTRAATDNELKVAHLL